MGLANWLTLLRIVLIPVFVLLLVYRRPGVALVVFSLAALTDMLDGYVARRRGSQSRLGAFLDPTADKLLLTASFVTLTQLRILPAWITIVVISRDVILVVGALLIHMLGGRIHPRPTWAGKAATFFQILTVLTGMLVRYCAHAVRRGARPQLRHLAGRHLHHRLRPAVPRARHALPQRHRRRPRGGQ